MYYYMIVFKDETKSTYFKAGADLDAICIALADYGENVLEVYQCHNDECLSPGKRIYPKWYMQNE